MSIDDQQMFKSRMMSCIFATDMGRHADDLKSLNSLIEENSITDGQNTEKLIEN